MEWKENPVMLILSQQSMPLGNIPFPSITICPNIKSSKSRFNYTDIYRVIHNIHENQSRTVTDEE